MKSQRPEHCDYFKTSLTPRSGLPGTTFNKNGMFRLKPSYTLIRDIESWHLPLMMRNAELVARAIDQTRITVSSVFHFLDQSLNFGSKSRDHLRQENPLNAL